MVEYLPLVMHTELQRLVCVGGCVVVLNGGVMNQFELSFGPAFPILIVTTIWDPPTNIASAPSSKNLRTLTKLIQTWARWKGLRVHSYTPPTVKAFFSRDQKTDNPPVAPSMLVPRVRRRGPWTLCATENASAQRPLPEYGVWSGVPKPEARYYRGFPQHMLRWLLNGSGSHAKCFKTVCELSRPATNPTPRHHRTLRIAERPILSRI
jgi:hypothetical protein